MYYVLTRVESDKREWADNQLDVCPCKARYVLRSFLFHRLKCFVPCSGRFVVAHSAFMSSVCDAESNGSMGYALLAAYGPSHVNMVSAGIERRWTGVAFPNGVSSDGSSTTTAAHQQWKYQEAVPAGVNSWYAQ
jgi:hypothetical protein